MSIDGLCDSARFAKVTPKQLDFFVYITSCDIFRTIYFNIIYITLILILNYVVKNNIIKGSCE